MNYLLGEMRRTGPGNSGGKEKGPGQIQYMAGQSYSTTWEGRSRPRTRQNAGGQGLTVQFARTDPTKYSFAVRSAGGWNKLPVNVRSATSSEFFRKRLKGKEK
jgi:hypothetical protein